MMANINDLPLIATQDSSDPLFDSFVYIAVDLEKNLGNVEQFSTVFENLKSLKEFNANFEREVSLIVINKQRIIYSPTGPIDRDYDDVRRISKATIDGVSRALKSGSKRPLLINTLKNSFKEADTVALLAALEAAYIPLEVREVKNNSQLLKADKIGFWHQDLEAANKIIRLVNGIELGRIVGRDIAGSDPERMSAPNIASYVSEVFKSTNIKISIIEGQNEFEKNYPCFAAVNRAANVVPRHQGRIIKLEYNPVDNSPIDQTLFLVGKGVTYDTGGADVKTDGHMAGMHRDKSGAASVAGFFKTLSVLKPKGLKVFGFMGLARNSIGEESYVADEIITSRAKQRIRVGNTDAEGRMVMVDLLCEAKEMALKEINPAIFTIATLTYHVILTYGSAYTAIMSNGPARKANIDQSFVESGDKIGEPFEASRLRQEDYDMVEPLTEYEDVIQTTNKSMAEDIRGHQYPTAFLIRASGLDKHGNDSENKLAYSHVDIAASSGISPGKLPTGSPVPTFVYNYLLPRI